MACSEEGSKDCALQHLPSGNCPSPLKALLQYTSFYCKSPPREVLEHRHSGVLLGYQAAACR